jgi:hypothetical protein
MLMQRYDVDLIGDRPIMPREGGRGEGEVKGRGRGDPQSSGSSLDNK